MAESILALLAPLRVFFRTRGNTGLELLALRQQVAVLKRKRPRTRLNRLDRFFSTALRQLWSRWTDALAIVKPEIFIGWHRAGFRLYWRWRSRSRGGQPKVSAEIRVLIQRLAEENPAWGAPKIHTQVEEAGAHSPLSKLPARSTTWTTPRRSPSSTWSKPPKTAAWTGTTEAGGHKGGSRPRCPRSKPGWPLEGAAAAGEAGRKKRRQRRRFGCILNDNREGSNRTPAREPGRNVWASPVGQGTSRA